LQACSFFVTLLMREYGPHGAHSVLKGREAPPRESLSGSPRSIDKATRRSLMRGD
jgi:hypothetical protein